MWEQQYSEADTKEILERALALQVEEPADRFSRLQLEEMARELGISREQLARAEQGWRGDGAPAPSEPAPVARGSALRDHERIFAMHRALFLLSLFLVLLIARESYAYDSPVLSVFPFFFWALSLMVHWWMVRRLRKRVARLARPGAARRIELVLKHEPRGPSPLEERYVPPARSRGSA